MHEINLIWQARPSLKWSQQGQQKNKGCWQVWSPKSWKVIWDSALRSSRDSKNFPCLCSRHRADQPAQPDVSKDFQEPGTGCTLLKFFWMSTSNVSARLLCFKDGRENAAGELRDLRDGFVICVTSQEVGFFFKVTWSPSVTGWESPRIFLSACVYLVWHLWCSWSAQVSLFPLRGLPGPQC